MIGITSISGQNLFKYPLSPFLSMPKAKIGRKEWYQIIAPKLFQNAVLGETYVYEPEKTIGKGLSVNLMSLTNDIKRQNININFKINSMQNGKALADVVGYYMAQSSVKRSVRKDINKIDMSFPCKASDGKSLRIKPLLITRSATKGSIVAKLRKKTEEFLTKYIKDSSCDTIINDLVNHKLQTALKKELNKIYPLRVCEIRLMEIIEGEGKKIEAKSVTMKEKKVKEEKNTEKEEKPKAEESIV